MPGQKTLSESRVLQLIDWRVSRAIRKALGSQLSGSVQTNLPIKITDPDSPDASIDLAYDSDDFEIAGGELALKAGVGGSGGEVFNEVPTGTIDGTNDTFTLNQDPVAGTILPMVNGVFMTEGSDYTFTSPDQVVFASGAIPQSGDTLIAHYQTP